MWNGFFKADFILINTINVVIQRTSTGKELILTKKLTHVHLQFSWWYTNLDQSYRQENCARATVSLAEWGLPLKIWLLDLEALPPATRPGEKKMQVQTSSSRNKGVMRISYFNNAPWSRCRRSSASLCWTIGIAGVKVNLYDGVELELKL